jgi:hypothetical protein
MASDEVVQEVKGLAISPDYSTAHVGDNVAVGIDDVAIIPKGQIDPIYEAKARVLNRAVRTPGFQHVVPCLAQVPLRCLQFDFPPTTGSSVSRGTDSQGGQSLRSEG